MKQEIQIAGTWRESEKTLRFHKRKLMLRDADEYLKRLIQEFSRRNSESEFKEAVHV